MRIERSNSSGQAGPGSPGASAEARPVGEIVDRIDALADAACVSLGDVIEAFGRRSFLPVMMVPALLVVSPLSGIPLFSSACGLSIAFIAAQMVWGRHQLWLPRFLMDRRIEGQKARMATRHLRRLAGWLDRHARSRLGPFMRRPFRKWVQVMCLICGAAMPILEIVPFSSSILGAAVLFLSTALMARDGLFVVFGIATMCTAVMAPLWALGVL